MAKDDTPGGLRDDRRRQALKLLATIPLGALLADSAFAADTACCITDVEIPLARTGRKVRAALALPAKTPAPVVVLFHEWWGLNSQIKTVAADLAAKQGVVALAIDLYNGEVTSDPAVARKLMTSLNPTEATETILAWMSWLKSNPHAGEKRATIGWCFGGGWSLNASLVYPMDATVIYYGDVEKTAQQLASLKGPVLGNFARQDQWINQTMVSHFEAEMAKAHKSLTVYWYDANHAFANPTGNNYNRADAKLAWSRTTAFLKAALTPV